MKQKTWQKRSQNQIYAPLIINSEYVEITNETQKFCKKLVDVTGFRLAI